MVSVFSYPMGIRTRGRLARRRGRLATRGGLPRRAGRIPQGVPKQTVIPSGVAVLFCIFHPDSNPRPLSNRSRTSSLPALATNAPPAHLLNASRSERFRPLGRERVGTSGVPGARRRPGGSNPSRRAKKCSRPIWGRLHFSFVNGDSNLRALGKAPGAPCNPRWPAPQGRSNPSRRAKM